MKTDYIKGIIVPILTPICNNEKINESKLRQMVDHVIEGGVHGILAFGSNGEFYMVEDDDLERGLTIMIDQAQKRIPIYMGIGAINTGKCIKLARMAEKLGAAGISILQPMFLKPTEDELYEHFKQIAQSIPKTPMLLYNNPGRTGYTMSAQLVSRLAHEVPNIVGMKDSSGDITQTSNFIRITRDINFKVFGGKDTLIYASLVHGAAGSVATTANMFPKLVTSIYNSYIAGDLKGSLEAQFTLDPVRILMDRASFPVATKDLANIMGLEVGKPYRPNFSSKDHLLEIFKEEVEKIRAYENN